MAFVLKKFQLNTLIRGGVVDILNLGLITAVVEERFSQIGLTIQTYYQPQIAEGFCISLDFDINPPSVIAFRSPLASLQEKTNI